MNGKQGQSIGDPVRYYDLDGRIQWGRITCFYPYGGYVDVMNRRGQIYRIRV